MHLQSHHRTPLRKLSKWKCGRSTSSGRRATRYAQKTRPSSQREVSADLWIYVFPPHEPPTTVFSVSVMFAYEQCLLVLGHHPDIWYEAAQYLEQSSKLLAEKGVRG